MVNHKDEEDAIAYLKDKDVPSMVNTLIEDILHHRPDQLTLRWLPLTGKATGPRFVLFSSRTPDKEDFKASLAVPSVEYDWNSSSAADLCLVLQNASRFYTGSEGFTSICVACHGPSQAVSGAFAWQVTANVVLTSPKQLEDDDDPATIFFKELGRSTISGGRVDLLACNLLQSQVGRDVFHKIEQVTKCNFAASEDVTGNVKSNTNWVMESDGVDISNLYFGNLEQFDGTFGHSQGQRLSVDLVVFGHHQAGKTTTSEKLISKGGGGAFSTDKYDYSIFEAPVTQDDFIKNMISGSIFAKDAKVGLLLIPAEDGAFEFPIRHAQILYELGIEQIIVGVNKMDSCQWSESRFLEIKAAVTKKLDDVGFEAAKIPIIPYSASNGENIFTPTSCPWFKGWTVFPERRTKLQGTTIFDALNSVSLLMRVDLPVRFCVSSVDDSLPGVNIRGTIGQGVLRSGDMVNAAPCGLMNVKLFIIEKDGNRVDSAGPCEHVKLTIKGIGAKPGLVRAGDIISLSRDGLLPPVKMFRGVIRTKEFAGKITLGHKTYIHVHNAKVLCQLRAVYWKQSAATGGERIEHKPFLEQYEEAEVSFTPTAPVVVDPFDACPATARFAAIDTDGTVRMVGRVTSVEI